MVHTNGLGMASVRGTDLDYSEPESPFLSESRRTGRVLARTHEDECQINSLTF
jgi:hypothetical protein